MAPFWDDEEEDELSPDQKAELYGSLQQKLAGAADPEGMRAAEDRADGDRFAANLGQSLGGLFSAAGRARGYKSDTGGLYNSIRQDVDTRLGSERQKRKDAVDQVVRKDEAGWKEKQRARTEGDWANADEDRKRLEADRGEEDNPESATSRQYQALAAKMMPSQDFSTMSASQIKKGLPTLEKMYQIDEGLKIRKETAADTAANRALQLRMLKEREDERRALAQEKIDAKSAKELEELTVGDVGVARTRDDAKQLKEAVEAKASFDRKVQEMIALREKYGGEAWNREAVERGQQLSNDALLAYKNMAKLGVLSVSDEAIINSIIPKDPLEFKASALVGQDPIMTRLKGLKSDTDKDYTTKLATRLRSRKEAPAEAVAKEPAEGRGASGSWENEAIASDGPVIVRKQYSPSRDQTKVVYSDGREEILDGKQ